ncbi:MAG: 3-hydroxyacyl-CoA dehydrogenase NAD-binding domain-containing protein [Legionellaceae bacterium]|nr:3-hydroxyacyl-CoA dehydrogenase NAD-binding domain-containing protein [Legionellaceae bacterium]
MSHYKNWQVTTDTNKITWLGIDVDHANTNVLGSEVLDELNSILQDISQMKSTQGLVIHSLKENGFIAGADVNEFAHFKKTSQIIDFLRKGQTVFAKLESLSIPKVAIIDGFCMGGGLELALACDYRIGTNSRNTKIGLPEVLLGIHPGWGGTVRLPKLIGGFHALSQVILTGSALSSRRAKSLGILDDVVPLRQLERAAIYFIEKTPKPHKPSFLQSLGNSSYARRYIAKLLRSEVAKKANPEHYPAPFAAIDLWEKEGDFNDRAYLKEADSVEKLIEKSDTAKNLTRVFLLRERIKSFAKNSEFSAKHVHVIGAGIMGGDIAAWCALQGIRVTLQDQTFAQIAPAIARANSLYRKKLRKPRLIQEAMDNLIPDPLGNGIAIADVIIEAVFENKKVKHEIIKNVEKSAKLTAIIATNTSSIPLDEINTVMKNPERLVGIHFFNPVSRMELVEVVVGSKTSQEITDNACSFVGQIGKMPLPVKSSPGFLINRVLTPYLLEAMQLLEAGYSPEVIDDAAKSFGMIMGPVELADTVGMDVCLAVADNLSAHFGGTIPEKLRAMVSAGNLGRKSGEGFYKYKKGRPVKKKLRKDLKKPDLSSKLIKAMLDEANKCLKDGVVEDADLLDGGMIFATGFAPFRGGPMHYEKTMSEQKQHKTSK